MMAYSIVDSHPHTDEEELVLVIKEEEYKLAEASKGVQAIEMKMLVFENETTHAILLLTRIDKNNDLTYETWINVHSPEQMGRKVIDLLMSRPGLYISIFNEKNALRRSIVVGNDFKDSHSAAFLGITWKVPWTDESFDQLRNSVYEEYPTWKALWQVHNDRNVH